MDEKSEMQNGEQFAPTSTPEEIPAEYRKTVRKEDGSPFTGEDLRAMVETVIPCIEEVNGEIRKIYLTASKLLTDNPPPELDKEREIVRYAGSHLFTVMDDLGRMEALTFLSQEGAEELERRRRRQIKTNRDAINLLDSAPEPWIKNVTLTVFFEQQGSNPDFADLFLMDFVQAAFDIENGWAIREGTFKEYIEQGKRQWDESSHTSQELQFLSATLPTKHLMPSNKVATSITDEDLWKGAIDLIVSQKKKKEILVHCSLTYEGDSVKISSRRPFTEYDRQVCDAVTSIFEYGDSSHIITPPMVYRAMVNATETETPSQQAIEAVTQSLDKMRFIRVIVDCSAELKWRGLSLDGDQITKGKIDTYLLAMDKVTVVAGGQEVAGYHILRTPILYAYSKILNQVSTVPAMLLDVKDKEGKTIRNTEKRIAIKGYLLRRISAMKGPQGKTLSNHITYSSVNAAVSEIDTTPPSKEESRRRRNYINDVLNFWTREGWIKGHTITKKGKELTGVEIQI